MLRSLDYIFEVLHYYALFISTSTCHLSTCSIPFMIAALASGNDLSLVLKRYSVAT